jgi:hypothetical protein
VLAQVDGGEDDASTEGATAAAGSDDEEDDVEYDAYIISQFEKARICLALIYLDFTFQTKVARDS